MIGIKIPIKNNCKFTICFGAENAKKNDKDRKEYFF